LFNDKIYSKPTVEKATELQLQHPPRENSHPKEYQKTAPHFTISPEATREIINKMNSNIHPGKDGFSIDVMKQLVRANSVRQGIKSASDTFVEEITTYFNRTIAQPTVSREISQYIAGGQMIAVDKKNGKIRAITMSDLGKKIVQYESTRQNKEEIKEELKDFQTAVGCANGTDKMIVTARLQMELHPNNDVLQTDCAKAFPNVKREAVLELMEDKLPNMLNMMEPLINTEGNFFYTGSKEGTQVIKVANGITAGESTSPVLFALVKNAHTTEQKKLIQDSWITPMTK
jgi:hypothetical protein